MPIGTVATDQGDQFGTRFLLIADPGDLDVPTYQTSSNPIRIQRLWTGAVLRALRRRGAWTQNEFARHLGVSDTTWSRFEQGSLPLPPELRDAVEDRMETPRGWLEAWGARLAGEHGIAPGTAAWRFRKAEEALADALAGQECRGAST